MVAAGVVERITATGLRRGDPVAVAMGGDGGLGLAVAVPGPDDVTSEATTEPRRTGGRRILRVEVPAAEAARVVAELEERLAVRWVMWNQRTAADLLAAGIRVARSWDVAAVWRFLGGTWRADEAFVWAAVHGLDPDAIPTASEPDLFNQIDPASDAASPIDEAGHLRATWATGAWRRHPGGAAAWAAAALRVAMAQREMTESVPNPPRTRAALRSESSIELLCAEMAADGLPVSLERAHELLAEHLGPPPRDDLEADARRAERDAIVFSTVGDDIATGIDLRSPGQVKTLLRRVGIEVPDTRSWTLRELRDRHPVVDALLWWRKAERLETTYGYRWLAEHAPDGRLRGPWSGCDGAAGRMTAGAGLHSIPAELRDAVRAEAGHVLVRADLGQVEPRVLAAVSGDAALRAACAIADLYTPVAGALGVSRDVAKVAVLGAMYGQTTGRGAEAGRRLRSAYPEAMAFLDRAAADAEAGRDLRTFGGRLIRVDVDEAEAELPAATRRGLVAARGRFGRNAVVQGAAAEFFKMWALRVRAGLGPLGGRIVLCLHDELLCHVPADAGADAAALVDEQLRLTAAHWFAGTGVEFVADTSVVTSWAEVP